MNSLRNQRVSKGVPSALELALLLVFLWPSTMAEAAPAVQNPSFEIDRYGVYPGYASSNGGAVAGWTISGGVGIDPWWDDPATQTGPNNSFSDNAIIPEAAQVLFIQNNGSVRQDITGFEAGKAYEVTYFENARHQNLAGGQPAFTVSLNGETLMSNHSIAPVEAMDRHTLPYVYAVSAPFVAPSSGPFELVFAATGAKAAVLIDNVQIRAIPAPTLEPLAADQASGDASGGYAITLSGSAFLSVTSVRFGYREAAFEVISDVEILVTVPSFTPPAGPNPVDIVVANAAGDVTTLAAFEYTGDVTAFSLPASGAVAQAVLISCVGLASGLIRVVRRTTSRGCLRANGTSTHGEL